MTSSVNPEGDLKISDRIIRIEYDLAGELNRINYGFPVEYVYNPLDYARDCHGDFVRRYFDLSSGKILFLGINPGPRGMCQNGIPFGDAEYARNWLRARGDIHKPRVEHPKVPVLGLTCNRREGSGKRFWGLIREICDRPEAFFRNCLVYNYCPLAFFNRGGGNVTPSDIKDLSKDFYELCDSALVKLIREIGVETVVVMGLILERRINKIIKRENITQVRVVRIPHPSARTRKTEEEWRRETIKILTENGIIDVLK